MSLREQFLSGGGNAHVLRHLAAVGVVLNHSFILFSGSKNGQPLRATYGISLGDIALDFFFLLSGFFIALSLQSRNHVGKFLAIRSARLHPALILSLLFTVLVIGPWYSRLDLLTYLFHGNTRMFLWRNLVMLVGPAFTLPGDVFKTNPFPVAVNGAIWTLAIEFRLILGFAIFWYLLKRNRYRCRIFAGTSLVLGIGALAMSLWLTSQGGFVHPGWRLHWLFFLGSWLHFTEIRIPRISPMLFVLGIALMLMGALLGPRWFPCLWLLLSPILLLGATLLPFGPFSKISRSTDYSYGIFVFAFPIQQAIVASGWARSPLELFLGATALVIPLAMASWHFVERPIGARVKYWTGSEVKTRGSNSIVGSK